LNKIRVDSASGKKSDSPDHVAERSTTVRDAIASALRQATLTAQQLSAEVSVQEREVAAHLTHLERSLRHGGERLLVLPPRCIKCGFVFEDRARRSKPSRCPSCKSERIEPPRFSITGALSPQ
jgi:predicted Zn-ribbon and HTH transcriptional regulator